MGSRKNEGGGRDDMVLYLRLSSPIHGTGWGTETDPAHNGGLYEPARLLHAMLFQTAVRGRSITGVFEATVGSRQFVLSIIDVSLTYGSPGMPPQWHEFIVTAELLQYNREDLQF